MEIFFKYNGLRQIIFEGEAKKYCTAFVRRAGMYFIWALGLKIVYLYVKKTPKKL